MERITRLRRARDVARMMNSADRAPSKLEGAAVPKTRQRAPASERPDPTHCRWYKNYVLDPQRKFRDANSAAGKLFRRRFRVTWHTYQEMVADANDCPDFARWHDGKCDFFGTPCTPLMRIVFLVRFHALTLRFQQTNIPNCLACHNQLQALLVLGSLRILGRGVVFDDIADFTGVSEHVVRDFFFAFIEHWSTVKFAHYVKMPTTEEELRTCEAEYAMGGLNGCIGSSDVCHVAWDRCRAARRASRLLLFKSLSIIVGVFFTRPARFSVPLTTNLSLVSILRSPSSTKAEDARAISSSRCSIRAARLSSTRARTCSWMERS